MGLGKYAVLVGAVAIAVLAFRSALAPYSLNLPWWFRDVLSIILSSSVVLFGVAVILGAIALVRGTALVSWGGRQMDIDALEIARRRYVRGEIDQEEFRRLRDDLRAGD